MEGGSAARRCRQRWKAADDDGVGARVGRTATKEGRGRLVEGLKRRERREEENRRARGRGRARRTRGGGRGRPDGEWVFGGTGGLGEEGDWEGERARVETDG